MHEDYLMNIATTLFFICYVPDFYANYANKNANIYNVFEKVIMMVGTGFALGYAISINSTPLLINYSPLFGLDVIALAIRGYYAYRNRNIDVRVVLELVNQPIPIENPMHDTL
jgi:hypothetical protein